MHSSVPRIYGTGVFLENLEMFEADYDDDNADEYACMHADGLLEDLCPGWNLT